MVNFPANLGLRSMPDRRPCARSAARRCACPERWSAAADYAWSRSRRSFISTGPIVGDPDGTTGPGVPVSTALTNGTLNVLADVNKYSLNWAPYLLPSPNGVIDPADTSLTDANLRFSGPVLRLPAGPLTLSSLVEYREEKAQETFRAS